MMHIYENIINKISDPISVFSPIYFHFLDKDNTFAMDLCS